MGTASALARRTLKHAARLADAVAPPRSGAVVLLYHRVGGGSGLELDLDRAVFADQIATLAAGARPVRTLADTIEALADPTENAATSPVAVTFDDGTPDFVEQALGILVEHSVPVTLYLATHFVDTGAAFPYGSPPLSWSAVTDACSTGLVEIGSHTHHHRRLDRCTPAEARDELTRSIDLIEDRLGRPVRTFAYPKAYLAPPAIEAEVRSRFESAVLAGTHANQPGRTDRYRVARSPIQRSDSAGCFAAKLAGGMRLEDRVRAAGNRLRQRNGTT